MGDNNIRLLLGCLGLAASLTLAWSVRTQVLEGQNDFVQIYVGAREAGGESLYQPDAYYAFMAEQFSARGDAILYTRPPFYALLLKPLSFLDYRLAHLTWIAIRLLAVVAFLWLMRRPTWADVVMMTCLSLPLSSSLLNGQDVAFLLVLVAAAIRLEERKRGFWAGAVLSLCSIKFHLFLLLPLLLFAQRKKSMAYGLGTGAVGLGLLSVLAAGVRWPLDYFRILTMNRINPEVDNMPNLHGLFSGLSGAVWLELFAVLAIVAVSWMLFRRSSFEVGLAIALAGGLLVSYHSYAADAVVLLPAFLLLMDRLTVGPLKAAMVILLFPPAWLILLGERPLSYLPQVAIVAIFAGVAWNILHKEAKPHDVAEPLSVGAGAGA